MTAATVPTTTPARLLHPLAAGLIAAVAAAAAYVGGSARAELVTHPLWSALVGGGCLLALCLPLVYSVRTIDDFFSPEVMAGVSFFFWIGLGTMANLVMPGESINPSLLDDLPWGMAAQTVGALAFFAGCRAAFPRAGGPPKCKTNLNRLTIVILLYAAFSVYACFFIERISADDMIERNINMEEVPMIHAAAPVIILETLSIIVVVLIYYRRYSALSHILVLPFLYNMLLTLTSGARREAIWGMLALLCGYILATRKVRMTLILGLGGCAAVAILLGTALRMNADFVAVTNPGGQSFDSISESTQLMADGTKTDTGDILHKLVVDAVYHFADAHAMAALLKSDQSPLWGQATVNSLFCAMPSKLRPAGYEYPVMLISDHYGFYKEGSVDSDMRTDWEISIAAWGYADFGWAGLVAYPWILGFLLRKIYRATVLSKALGAVGWLVYVPLMQDMWFPHNFGPACLQELRFLAVLACAVWWTRQPLASPDAADECPAPAAAPLGVGFRPSLVSAETAR